MFNNHVTLFNSQPSPKNNLFSQHEQLKSESNHTDMKLNNVNFRLSYERIYQVSQLHKELCYCTSKTRGKIIGLSIL